MIDNFKEVIDQTMIIPHRRDENVFVQVELKKDISDSPIKIWRVRCKDDMLKLKFKMIDLARYHEAKIYLHPNNYIRDIFYRNRLLELSKENVYGVFTDNSIDWKSLEASKSRVNRYVYEFLQPSDIKDYLKINGAKEPTLVIPGINCIQAITFERYEGRKELPEILLYDFHSKFSKRYVCDKCGSDRVFVQSRVNPNTGKQYTLEEDWCWCEECKSKTKLVIK